MRAKRNLQSHGIPENYFLLPILILLMGRVFLLPWLEDLQAGLSPLNPPLSLVKDSPVEGLPISVSGHGFLGLFVISHWLSIGRAMLVREFSSLNTQRNKLHILGPQQSKVVEL